jgi:Asp-tRNA(Asn)/Glu-tRNA(Gln) amidotransferase B subunit
MKLDPECFKPSNLFFLKASGHVYPCCYTASSPIMANWLGKELVTQLNVNEYTLTEITHSEAWDKMLKMITSDEPIHTCIEFCVKRDKRPEQDAVNNLKTQLKT